MSTAIEKPKETPTQIQRPRDESPWATVQRRAKAYADSAIVPDAFRGNVANCIVALEMASRMGASELAVMQSLYLVHGKPSWSSQFLIAAVNSCGRFKPLKFAVSEPVKTKFGNKEIVDRTCIAWTTDKATGERLEGPPVSIAMAYAEGWATKNGSKWLTMPDLMLRYRAATFFSRLYASDVTLGLKTTEEIHDMGPVQAEVVSTGKPMFTEEPDWNAVAATVEQERAKSEPPPAPTREMGDDSE